MNKIPTSQILESLNWRYATKAFDNTRKLSEAELEFVKEAMRLSPSSYGIQAWKFIEIKNPAVREAQVEVGWNQRQYVDASNLFAFCTYADPINKAEELVGGYVEQIVDQRGVTRESLKGYEEMMLNAMKNGNTSGDPAYSKYWLECQLYIALGQTMAACAVAGIDTCPLEGFDIAKANNLLGLEKEGLHVKAFLAVGFRGEGDKYSTAKKVRNPADEIFIER